jgi:glycosyltransferase involved in cell wall biosynthesis
MLKILFLLHLPPPVHGSSVMGKHIKESKLLNEAFDGFHINLLASKKLKGTGKFSGGKLFHAVIVMLRVIKRVLFHKPDLCYFALTTTGKAFYRDSFYILFLKTFGIKIIYHLHNKCVSSKNNPLDKAIYKWVFSNSKVILLSKLLYYDIEKYVRTEDVFICPNGIPSEVSTRIIKQENHRVKLLFLSNLIKSKGVYVLVDALAILKKKGFDFECDIVGGEADISKEELKNYIELRGLEKKIIYRGKKYGKDKTEFFEKTDIFVFPTFYKKECFPLVIIEAMLYSLPVVSTKEGGIPDVVDDGTTGLLCEKQAPQSLADKIQVLLNDKDLRTKVGREGFLKYKRYYTIEKFEINLKQIFNTYSVNT